MFRREPGGVEPLAGCLGAQGRGVDAGSAYQYIHAVLRLFSAFFFGAGCGLAAEIFLAVFYLQVVDLIE